MNPALTDKNELNDAGKAGAKILVATGSSGGHIFPALAFLETLKVKYSRTDVFLLLPERSAIKKIEGLGCKVKYIDMPSVRLSINRKNIRNILKIFKGSLEYLVILLRFQPDIVVGFGSLASIPAVMFAWLLRTKTLIHEQNVTLGRANRLLAAFADKIAVSFDETKSCLRNYKRKVVVTGNPLRATLERIDKLRALGFFGFSPDKFTILVMGGSQGSRRINTEFLKSISSVRDRSNFQIIHLCGRPDFQLLNDKYKDLNIKFSLFEFFGPMEYAYSASDLVISRAGATSIAEVMFFGLPVIFIPYPYAYKHQYANAKTLEEKKCAVIIKDEEFNAAVLKENLEYFLVNPGKLEDMRACYRNFPEKANSGDLLAEEAMSFN